MRQTLIEAVILDADGTLVDSEEIGLAALQRQARQVGVALSAQDLAALRGQPMGDGLEAVARRRGRPLPRDFEASLRAEMARCFERELRPMPGAAALLGALTARQLPFCVATNGPRSKVAQTLRLTGLDTFLGDRVFCAPEIGHFKPAPGLFLAAAAALGCPPARCAVVEDSVPGMEAGLAAGMQVFCVRSERPLPATLAARVHLLDRLEDLPA